MFQTGQFSKIKKGLQSIGERWRGKKNQTVIPAPVKPALPKFTDHQVDWNPQFDEIVVSIREMQSRAKMNRTKAHRQQMKKFHKKQVKANKRYKMKG